MDGMFSHWALGRIPCDRKLITAATVSVFLSLPSIVYTAVIELLGRGTIDFFNPIMAPPEEKGTVFFEGISNSGRGHSSFTNNF